MHNFGNCYLDGNGVNIDNNKAFELFKKSAEEYPGGITMLGYCYFDGSGLILISKKHSFHFCKIVK